jgi:hypothetical protein
MTEVTIPTWTDLSAEADRLAQMGTQTVEQAIKVGTMLSGLRPTCSDQKEFVQRVGQATGYKKAHAFNLMSLAQHQAVLLEKKPDSIRQALALIRPPASPTVSSEKKLPDPQSEVPVKQMVATIKSDAQLSGRMADRYDRAVEKMQYELTCRWRSEFNVAVRKKFEATQPDRIEKLKEREERVTAEMRKYQAKRNGIPAQMTVADYKFLIGLLHPDRAPAGMEDKFDKAFQIIRKLDEYMKIAQEAAT